MFCKAFVTFSAETQDNGLLTSDQTGYDFELLSLQPNLVTGVGDTLLGTHHSIASDLLLVLYDALLTTPTAPLPIIIDSGASSYMMPLISMLVNFSPMSGTVTLVTRVYNSQSLAAEPPD